MSFKPFCHTVSLQAIETTALGKSLLSKAAYLGSQPACVGIMVVEQFPKVIYYRGKTDYSGVLSPESGSLLLTFRQEKEKPLVYFRFLSIKSKSYKVKEKNNV